MSTYSMAINVRPSLRVPIEYLVRIFRFAGLLQSLHGVPQVLHLASVHALSKLFSLQNVDQRDQAPRESE